MLDASAVPTMVCHRGANQLAPENTLSAVRKALELGRVFVEIDVRTSADGVPVVIHDRTVDRTTDGTGRVEDLRAAEIGRLDAGSWFGPAFAGERVPRLEEIYPLMKGRGGLYVEIKAADPTTVVDMAADHGMLEDCFFWSEDWSILDRLKADHRRLALMIRYQDYTDRAAALGRYQPAIMEFTPPEVTEAALDLCRRHGARPMACYMGKDPDVFRGLLTAGIDLFNLDHPEVFKTAGGAA